MIDAIKKLMAGPPEKAMSHDEELRFVAASLLFRAVYVDGIANAEQVAMVRRIIDDEFGLDQEAADLLMRDAAAAAANASDLYGWTKRVNEHYNADEKDYLMERLWQVVLADDHLDDLESAMMRRIAGLIYVSDAASAAARRRAKTAIDGGKNG